MIHLRKKSFSKAIQIVIFFFMPTPFPYEYYLNYPFVTIADATRFTIYKSIMSLPSLLI